MGCASSQAAESMNSKVIGDLPTAPVSANSEKEQSNKYRPAEAFEIPLDGDQPISIISTNDIESGSTSIIKKHPPKRLQRLIEQSSDNNLTPSIEDLTEKLAKAEVRRQQILQQKVDTAMAHSQSVKESIDHHRSPGDGDEEFNETNEANEKH